LNRHRLWIKVTDLVDHSSTSPTACGCSRRSKADFLGRNRKCTYRRPSRGDVGRGGQRRCDQAIARRDIVGSGGTVPVSGRHRKIKRCVRRVLGAGAHFLRGPEVAAGSETESAPVGQGDWLVLTGQVHLAARCLLPGPCFQPRLARHPPRDLIMRAFPAKAGCNHDGSVPAHRPGCWSLRVEGGFGQKRAATTATRSAAISPSIAILAGGRGRPWPLRDRASSAMIGSSSRSLASDMLGGRPHYSWRRR
jgi:hypothetical protein